jgi:RNA polymerase sigma-70 factor (ECF subfamily)
MAQKKFYHSCNHRKTQRIKSNEMDEKVIIKKIQQGSREALGMLWKSHSTNVLNLAFRMLKNRDEAEDVLMDIFVSVPGKIKNFRGESALNTWLFRLTVNECLMRLRSKKRHAELEGEHIELLTASAIGSKHEEQIDYDPELLEFGLSKLSAETRSMLWLKDAEELGIKDLSEIYNMPEGTIKARLSRARTVVKNYLQENVNYA